MQFGGMCHPQLCGNDQASNVAPSGALKSMDKNVESAHIVRFCFELSHSVKISRHSVSFDVISKESEVQCIYANS